ncbi:MAG TPA: hypothetical protein VHX42_03720 [Candidatus Babeliales bacterium]|jgi:hypothetical protein|nr:hypothetical protein [Candidatus Babeliales bacterium]
MNFLIKKRSSIAQSLFFVAHLFFVTSLCADVSFTGPLTQVATLGYGKDVFLIEDAHKKQFILKYNTKNHCITPDAEPSIHETVGAKIGIAADININDVKIIPAHDTSLQSVDKYPHITKTVHTVVPGTEVDKVALADHINICGALIGQRNLTSLTLNKDLCKIAALDIFTSNIDRHNGNLFIDNNTNRFYAIDMDWIFNDIYNIPNSEHITYIPQNFTALREFLQKPYDRFLATQVYTFLKNIDPKKLSDKEIEALKEINSTLQKLQAAYPPNKLFTEWMDIAQQAHYTYSIQKQQCIRYLLEYNHREISKICAQINRILSDNSYMSHIQKLKDMASLTWQNTSLNLLACYITLKNYNYHATLLR